VKPQDKISNPEIRMYPTEKFKISRNGLTNNTTTDTEAKC
jgi:hypothetical protein